jgi:hypothetical protein
MADEDEDNGLIIVVAILDVNLVTPRMPIMISTPLPNNKNATPPLERCVTLRQLHGTHQQRHNSALSKECSPTDLQDSLSLV